MRDAGKVPAHVVWLCKGFEADSQLLPHQVVAAELPGHGSNGVLSGPSFAREVGQGLPVALTIASASAACRERTVAAFHHGAMRIYTGDDIVGVEVGGAVKNVLAIATGIADGLGLGLNARAALITRGLAEMSRLGVTLGGRAETFTGLTGPRRSDPDRHRATCRAIARSACNSPRAVRSTTSSAASVTWPKACVVRKRCWRSPALTQSRCRSRRRSVPCCSTA